MKKITLFVSLLFGIVAYGQQKSTGVVNLTTNVRANFLLDSSTEVVTLTMIGPNDRWFGLQFGSFTSTQGMLSGQDLVWWNNVTVVDSRFNGEGNTPTTDATNNWTLVSNTNNAPSAGLRTIVCTRPFSTGDSNDYAFNFDDTSIDIAWARASTANYTLNNHGSTNRGYAINTPYTTLGTTAFEAEAVTVYPNPSKGTIQITAQQKIQKITVFSIAGKQLQELTPRYDDSNQVQVIESLAKGVYLVQIVGDDFSTWKKVIVE